MGTRTRAGSSWGKPPRLTHGRSAHAWNRGGHGEACKCTTVEPSHHGLRALLFRWMRVSRMQYVSESAVRWYRPGACHRTLPSKQHGICNFKEPRCGAGLTIYGIVCSTYENAPPNRYSTLNPQFCSTQHHALVSKQHADHIHLRLFAERPHQLHHGLVHAAC